MRIALAWLWRPSVPLREDATVTGTVCSTWAVHPACARLCAATVRVALAHGRVKRHVLTAACRARENAVARYGPVPCGQERPCLSERRGHWGGSVTVTWQPGPRSSDYRRVYRDYPRVPSQKKHA